MHQILAPSKAELNFLNYENVKKFIEKAEPDLVINCAGRVGGIQANINSPVSFLVDNVDINRNIILASKACGVPKMINLGSSCMYPKNAPNPLREEYILTGELESTNEGYAIAKIFAQKLCDYISRENPKLKYKTLVPCNLYGPFDKFDPENSHLIPAIIHKVSDAIQNKRTEVEIWGNGEARREFMYVGDLVDCIQKAIHEFDELPGLMNVGLGEDSSVNEYYKIVSNILNYQGKFIYDLSKPVGMKQKLISTEKAQAWGWKHRVSLSEGIDQTINYYKTIKKD